MTPLQVRGRGPGMQRCRQEKGGSCALREQAHLCRSMRRLPGGLPKVWRRVEGQGFVSRMRSVPPAGGTAGAAGIETVQLYSRRCHRGSDKDWRLAPHIVTREAVVAPWEALTALCNVNAAALRQGGKGQDSEAGKAKHVGSCRQLQDGRGNEGHTSDTTRPNATAASNGASSGLGTVAWCLISREVPTLH
jgi:hypothetical protein